jgi:hypothetical protein
LFSISFGCPRAFDNIKIVTASIVIDSLDLLILIYNTKLEQRRIRSDRKNKRKGI